jgi:hypothetical protein
MSHFEEVITWYQILLLGAKVHYIRDDGSLIENGIIARLDNKKPGVAWVVYHCDNKWEEYYNYTAAATPIKNLRLGWWHPPVTLG